MPILTSYCSLTIFQSVIPADIAQLALQNISPPDDNLVLDSSHAGVKSILKHSKMKGEVALWENKYALVHHSVACA